MRVKIEVTGEDIENGEPLDPFHCPIGLALHRTTGEWYKVNRRYVQKASTVTGQRHIALSEEAKKFIVDFDRLYWAMKLDSSYEVPMPFTFEIDGVKALVGGSPE